MVDTVRTRSDLLTNLFQDGQADSSITEQDMRDLIVSHIPRGGWKDYNDATTSGTPISITGGAGYTNLTNDGAGSFTLDKFIHPSITDVWDTTNNQLDFSELELYDIVRVRIDVTITTSTTNTEVVVALGMANGGASPFDLIVGNKTYKTSGAQESFVIPYFFYIGSSDVLNNPAKIKVKADNNITVVVNGWVVQVEKY